MKKRLQTAISCLLVCLMLLSATACRNKGDVTSDTGSEITSSDTDGNLQDDISSDDITDTDISLDDDLFGDLETDSNDDSNKDTSISIPDVTIPGFDDPTLSGKDPTSSTSSGSTDEEKETNVVDKFDKPAAGTSVYTYNPMKSLFDEQANTLRKTILSTTDKLPSTVTGKVWYISNKGKDTNSGTSKEEAWASIFGMNFNKSKIKAGDAVLFERGGVYRGTITTISGVYYGAYGTGEKPCIYGSEMNYAKVNWRYKNNNIWVCEAPFSTDVGLIVFNHGEKIGFKKDKNYDLENIGDFWCDSSNSYTLYVYMDKNPADVYDSIEIGTKKAIIESYSGTTDVTIENLCLKYTGGHAITGTNTKRITVRGCEIGYIGGSYIGGTLRYGNGVEFFKGCEDSVVEYNWIYEIYDSGITHQGGGEYIAKNILMQKNLVEYCGMGSYEYWLSDEWDVCRGENITFADNICRFAGYCFGGEQRDDQCSTHIRTDVSCRNTMFNCKITGNIFDQSAVNLLEIGGTAVNVKDIPQNPAPVLSGNIYAQNTTGYLGTYFSKAGIIYDEDRETFIKDYMGDKQAVIYTY